MIQRQQLKRALLSVSDKTGIVDFAKQLQALNIEILSTGGTAKLLQEASVAIQEVSQYTKFPEMMDGRVKTLHPKVHGGLLGRRGTDDAVMTQHQISPIDLLVVNLYPFEATVANPDCELSSAIENIDIGGPAMVRSAAKNYQDVTVIVDSADYPLVIEELKSLGQTRLSTRFYLAKKAFARIANYDAAIANYLESLDETGKRLPFPATLTLQFQKKQDLRYGENPHQNAAFYIETNNEEASIARSQQLQGKELSYNNIADADAALECVKSFNQPACVIVKHANPCGVAVATDLTTAYKKAFSTDPVSAFGGIIACNQTVDETWAHLVLNNQFLEVLIAPAFTPEALIVLQKKPAIRILQCGPLTHSKLAWDFKKVTGGLLVQDRDDLNSEQINLKTVTQRTPNENEMKDLLFAWNVAKFVKSNAIVFAKEQMTIGIGAGQMSRVDSVMLATHKAGLAQLSPQNAVMASDAFFPFRDGIDAAVAAGITAIIQPGGSIRDNEIIAAADEANLAMVFTGVRHFRH